MPAVIDVTPGTTDPNSPCAAIKATLDAYIKAEIAALGGISVRWGDRSISRANLPELRQGRAEWEAKYNRCMQGCGSRMGANNVSLAQLNDADASGCIEGAERQNFNRNCGPC